MPYAAARAPLRIPLGGGGTDLAWYAGDFGGSALVATISAGVSVRIKELPAGLEPTEDALYKGSQVSDWTQKALAHLGRPGSRYEVQSVSDVPGGSGLGSSGAYLVALAAGIAALEGRDESPETIARSGTAAEVALAGGEAGPQDTWASALGGLRRLDFHSDGSTSSRPSDFPQEALAWLDTHVVLAHSGISRSAAVELRRQRRSMTDRREELHRVKALGSDIEAAIRGGDLVRFAGCLREHDELKRRRSPVPEPIDRIIHAARSAGAIATKVIGAGGGGVILFVCPDERSIAVRDCLQRQGATALDTRFSPVGVTSNRWENSGA